MPLVEESSAHLALLTLGFFGFSDIYTFADAGLVLNIFSFYSVYGCVSHSEFAFIVLFFLSIT